MKWCDGLAMTKSVLLSNTNVMLPLLLVTFIRLLSFGYRSLGNVFWITAKLLLMAAAWHWQLLVNILFNELVEISVQLLISKT